MRHPTDDLRIVQTRPLIPPAILQEELPIGDEVAELVYSTREALADCIHSRSKKLVAVVGPCSIHDPAGALEYASRLKAMADEVQDAVHVVMRTYFEKPRTSVGWKGLINDPDLDETFHVNKGIRLARKLLLDINELGLPTGSEFLDLQLPQQFADVTSWVAIGARTSESQVHRELASGLSMPVGFKNTTDGNLGPAIDAVHAARSPHWFPSVTKQGVAAISQTTGNPDCHIIMRGGTSTGPNYSEEHVAKASEMLAKRGLPTRVMIDCSHGNSLKDHRKQGEVLRAVAQQVRAGSSRVLGVMLESNLMEGRQDAAPGRELVFGQSITDACIGIEETGTLLSELASAV